MSTVPDFRYRNGIDAAQNGMSPASAASGYHRGVPRSSLDRVINALTTAGVKHFKRGDHVQASCPAHEDGHPSLSIDYDATNARVLANCQARCGGDDVLDALGMTWPELYDDYEAPEVYAARRREERGRGVDRPKRATKPRKSTTPKGRLPQRVVVDQVRPLEAWKVSTTYDYVDVQGTMLQQEVRHERPVEVTAANGTVIQKTDKRFTQRWPDGRGDWLDKTPQGFEPVLYGLPAVLDWIDAGRVIWLCEGVKDVERFLELGEAATTNPSGARNFKASQAQTLAGAHVVVVIDHDAAGYGRAIRLHELMADRAATLRFALPRTTEKHSDASDHFDAGHGLNFAEADLGQLVALEQIALAEEEAAKAEKARHEVMARLSRASTAADGARKLAETKAAQRWAEETGTSLLKVVELPLASDAGEALQQRRDRAIDQIRDAVNDAYDAISIDVPAPVAAALATDVGEWHPAESDDDTEEPASVSDEPGGRVIDGPGVTRSPEPTARIPMSRGTWAYEVGGEGRRPRGVYTLNDSRWVRVADLPYIQARIIERDGSGRRTGMQWLASAQQDEPGLIITWDDLGTGRWANMLDLSVSRDKRVEESAATAFELIGQEAVERERTPRVEDGRISVPVPDTLPGGYLVTGDLDRGLAIEQWREILRTAALSPRLALVLGAAAVGPYVGALRRQSHIVALYGDSDNGKSVTMSVAGAIWGDTLSDGSAVVRPWNSTGNGVIRFLGQLGVLPGFFDEAGQANATSPREWGKLIYDICEGAQRMGAEMRGLGVRITMPWNGILISAGNGRLTDGLGAGRYAGIAKRVIDVETPLTISAEHAEHLTALLPGAVGHIGHEILERHNTDTVSQMIAEAEQVLGMPDGGNERTIARHLHAHVAGAMILDQIAGAEGALYYAALQAAADYLDQWAPPEHDADRMVDAIQDAIGREPAMWPEVGDYLEHKLPPVGWNDDGPTSRPVIPGHGINRSLSGILRTDAETGVQTVWVFGHFWKALCEEIGADSAVACRELNKREILRRTESSRRANEWTTKVRHTGSKMYELRFGPDMEAGAGPVAHRQTPSNDSPAPESGPVATLFTGSDLASRDESAETAPVPGESSGRSGSVPGDVPGINVALTCSVPGVPGESEKETHVQARVDAPTTQQTTQPTSKPSCVVCGYPASEVVDGVPLHLGECAENRAVQLAQVEAVDPSPEVPAAEPEELSEDVQQPQTDPRRSSAREPRFLAPAACLADELHLAGGVVRPFPELRHLGDLAQLVDRDHLRLGWGGGEDRLPDPGQIWLYPAALERLGLPLDMPLPDKALNRSQRATASQKMFAKLDEHPMVAAAIADGWQFGQGGHLAVWTRIWHSELLPGGAFLVGLPWHHIEDIPLLDGDPAPGVLADRLRLFAQHVGVAYRLTTAATGLDLIDHARPPRRSLDDDLGSNRNRVSVVKNTPAELPAWRKKTSDARFTGLEQDFSWWRRWSALPASEQGLKYVHAYDRNASYLTPWQSLILGVEDLQHHEGEKAAWNGKEKPGYYLVDEWDWPYWGLPDPGIAAGARVGKGRLWVTVHTMRQLAAHGIEPVVHESYTWGTTARYLEGPGKTLSQARKSLLELSDTSDDAAAVLGAIKLLYSATVGKLAEREHRPDFHLWRPDWRDHVLGATKTAILRTLTDAGERSNRHPLAVDRDAIFYASDDPNPASAWPGDPAKLGTNLGSWKAIGSAELAVWGPDHLEQKSGRWHYTNAVQALTKPDGGENA